MNSKTHASLALLGAMLLTLTLSCKNTSIDYTQYVDPMIGTGGHGHTYPGAVVPHGMIQPSPDTRIYQWDACSGYHYSDSTINGFSHTHLSGTGCGDYGDVLLMPTVGQQKYQYTGALSQQQAYNSAFSHDNEVAEPGYYSVQLDTYGVKAELTATKRGAIHRYTFPQSEEAGFILDLDYSLQRQQNSDMILEIVSDTEVRGHKKTKFWAFDQVINFYAVFSRPMKFTLITDSITIEDGVKIAQSKVLAQFASTTNEQVQVKVGISAVDMEGARANVMAEIPDWDFDKVRNNARADWNDYLSKIEITTQDQDQKKIFYTALYHTAVAPNLFTDVDGRYLGMDLKEHTTTQDKPIYTVFSLWDTFRALHPLLTIIDPKLNEDLVASLLTKAKEGGVLPMWELAGNYTGTMIGYHAVSVITDAYMKGARNFDLNEAYQACKRVSEGDTSGIIAPSVMKRAVMPDSKMYKNTIGYVPCDKEHESVAKGLEYAYNDWCISLLAKEVGDKEGYDRFAKRAEAYKYYYDSTTCFMRGLDSKGKWRTPFSPRSSNHREDDYCEGTAWQWTWFAPHQVDGLVSLMGGREKFITRLDSLFVADSSLEGDLVSADISGLIGQYAHGNEPGHHITHLYNYVGEPWKTQELVDKVLHTLYFNNPNGLSGNEDCGQMSAWYILNAMGFYQVAPGRPVYSIGRPLFTQVKINLPQAKTFTIQTTNNSADNKYIQSAKLNGKPLDTPFFTHDDLMQGGILEFVMGDKPSQWGVAAN